MKKTFIVVPLFVLLFLSSLVKAQETLHCETWSLDDPFTDIKLVGDGLGNVYVANTSISSVAKYSEEGELIWSKPFNNTRVTAMTVDVNGHLLITGRFEGSLTFGTLTLDHPGEEINYLVRYDAEGTVLLAITIGEGQNVVIESMDTDAAGNVFLTGGFNGQTAVFGSYTVQNTSSDFSVFTVKTSSDGTVLWAKSADTDYYAMGRALTVDSEGHVIIAGIFRAAITFDNLPVLVSGTESTPPDIFLVKYTTEGDALWSERIAASVQSTSDYISELVKGPEDALYMSGAADAHVFVKKFDKNGAALWTFKSEGNGSSSGRDLAVDNYGNSYLCSVFNGTDYTFGDTTFTLPEADYTTQALVAKLDNEGHAKAVVLGHVPENAVDAQSICISGDNVFFGGFTAPSLTLSDSTFTETMSYLSRIKRDDVVTSVTTSATLLPDVFPNPTRGRFQLVNLPDASWKLKATSLNGAHVYESEQSGSNLSMDLSGAAPGIYSIEWYSEEAHYGVTKLIVE